MLSSGSLGGATAEAAGGAEFHPAFSPLHRPKVPEIRRGDLPRTAIDRFVAARLEPCGLGLAGEADRATLVRRAAFTLTGLPPTPEEVEAFERDPAPDAYERMIDRYFASPRYGERWGKLWLDAAGYADSNGYFNADTDRPLAWRYRDYVVRSFNANRPFDRFVREQLAGDELAAWRPGQPVTPEIVDLLEATHFLRNGQDGSGESDGNPDEVRADRYYALESALQIVGSCLLGTTLQCAKCHDHKFEPVTQREYYALEALLYPAFNIERWSKPNDRVVEAPLPGEAETWQARERELDALDADRKTKFAAWNSQHRPRGRILFEDRFDDGETVASHWSATAPGDDAPGGTPAVALDADPPPAARIRDGTLRIVEGGGAGDRWLSTRTAFDWRPARAGEWIRASFDLVATRLGDEGRAAERVGYFIAAQDFDDNGSVPGGNILIDGHPDGPSQVQVDYPGGDASSRGTIGASGYRAGHNYGVRIERTAAGEFLLEHLYDGVPDGASIKLSAADLPPGGFAFEYCCARSFVVDNVVVETSDAEDPDWVKREGTFREAYAERRKEFEEEGRALAARRTPKPGRIAWVSDAGAEPPKVPLLKRGNPKTPGDAVEPGFPAFLSGPDTLRDAAARVSGTTGRRLALAEWLTAPGSAAAAMLARVTVNRVWQGCFGVGIVSTTDNLGRSGAAPTHPELLEWLAAEFVESGWDLKALQRAMVCSAVFRQTSVASPEAFARDRSNERLSRFPLRRLEAEAIRDGMLAASGRLGPRTSGPYVPTQRTSTGEVVVDESRDDAFSRSLYLQQRRTQVTSMLGLFDAPALVFNCTRRASTTQPLQSLNLLNSEFAVKRGADLAARLERDCGSDADARITRAFRLTTGRAPDPDDLLAARRFLDHQEAAYAGRDDARGRAWADFCQSLLASNAFLYLE